MRRPGKRRAVAVLAGASSAHDLRVHLRVGRRGATGAAGQTSFWPGRRREDGQGQNVVQGFAEGEAFAGCESWGGQAAHADGRDRQAPQGAAAPEGGCLRLWPVAGAPRTRPSPAPAPQMYKERAVRDHKGRLIYQSLQSSEVPKARIQPDRRWFGNTRVIGQKQLERFR